MKRGKVRGILFCFFIVLGLKLKRERERERERERGERMNSHVTCLIMNWNVVA